MACDNTIEEARKKLIADGYSGLFYPGECACVVDDLAPCGECQQDDDEYINDCEPGYMFKDPRPGAPIEWMVRRENKTPTIEDWEKMDRAI